MSEINEKEIIENKNSNKNSKIKEFFKEIVIDIAIVAAVAFVVWRFIGFGVYIPSKSMVPTLQVNDRLVVARVHNTDNMKRGDIIVFNSDELDETLIKRLIGLPGDHIDIMNGIVSVNGEVLDEDYVKNKDVFNGSFDVPEGKFFFLGDNRPHSNDSRYWENHYVDAKDIEAKAVLKYYPIKDFGTIK